MSVQSKPRFERRRVKGMRDRMESYCKICGNFIAASNNRAKLMIAEKAHICAKAKPAKKL
jgi:hypothetical protein